MKVIVLSEHGLEEALLGIGLSYGLTSGHTIESLRADAALADRLLLRADQLAYLDGGHNKFLESLGVHLDVTAARELWQQLDTYRTGITKLSESTMHTITKRPLVSADFEAGVDQRVIDIVNEYIAVGDWDRAKLNLPEGFLQRRVVATNYMTLRNIAKQRRTHRLHFWQEFIGQVESQLCFPQWLYLKPPIQQRRA